MRERETLSEVDDVFQSLFDGKELPLFLRGTVVDGERQRLPIIPTFTHVGTCSLITSMRADSHLCSQTIATPLYRLASLMWAVWNSSPSCYHFPSFSTDSAIDHQLSR